MVVGLGGRRAALVALSSSIVALVASASWAGPLTPVPVKDDPQVWEGTPTSAGAWFAWEQPTPNGDNLNLFVQRGTSARIKVNAPGTGSRGGSLNHHGEVIYAQNRGDKLPRLFSFNLRTKLRTPLPAAVNQATWHNDRIRIWKVSADGPWVLYSGASKTSGYDLVLVYNRVTRKLQVLEAANETKRFAWAGQVNGRFATWQRGDLIDSYGPLGSDGSTIVRRDLRTGKNFKLTAEVRDRGVRTLLESPAVSPDGTLYYWRTRVDLTGDFPALGPYKLIRRPLGGPPEVIFTLPDYASETFVRRRPDGANVVFYGYKNDIYRIVDAAPTP